MNPLLLCAECDEQSHQGARDSHLRFDLTVSSGNLSRKESLRSNNSDSGTEEDSDVSYRL